MMYDAEVKKSLKEKRSAGFKGKGNRMVWVRRGCK
jgi:hypothetical protein